MTEATLELPILGTLPDSWRIVRFGDLLMERVTNGVTKPRAVRGQGFKMVNMGELFAYPRIKQQEMERVPLTSSEQERFLLRHGDLLFARQSLIAEGAGACSIVLCEGEPRTFEGHLLRARPDPTKASSEFLFYAFRSLYGKYAMRSIVRQVAAAGITGSDLMSLPVPCPPVGEQQAIAAILTAFDDKIELNRQMNETLEAIAQAIFKSWFVDFEPVHAKMQGRQPAGIDPETTALFPDSFEDSMLGKTPKGWTVAQLRTRASSVQYGLTRSASQICIGPRFLRITDIQGGRVDWDKVPFCSASSAEHERYRIHEGDIFIARTGASTGENIYVIDPPDAVFASYLIRLHFASPNEARVIGAFLRTRSYFDYVAGAIGGSAQPNASAQVLAGATFAFPPADIAKRFREIVRPLDVLRAALVRESQVLSAIRDALLPKLLSGEMRVNAG